MYTHADYVSQTTMTLRASSSSTTYTAGDDIIGDGTTYRNYTGGGIHKPRYYELHFKAGTDATPDSLTSYTEGQTLYYRWFIKVSGNTFYLVHGNAHAAFTYQEIAL